MLFGTIRDFERFAKEFSKDSSPRPEGSCRKVGKIGSGLGQARHRRRASGSGPYLGGALIPSLIMTRIASVALTLTGESTVSR